MRILIVEDDFAQRRLLHLMLTAFGQVDVAVNGREAVEAVATAHGESSPYSLICLDIMMPEMDGLTALRRIRQLEAARRIMKANRARVIVTSALDDARNVLGARESGCDAYLTKPFDKARILAEMAKLGLAPVGSGLR